MEGGKRFDDVGEGDVVQLPASGASLLEECVPRARHVPRHVCRSSCPRLAPRSRRCRCWTRRESQPSTRLARGSQRWLAPSLGSLSLSLSLSLSRLSLRPPPAARDTSTGVDHRRQAPALRDDLPDPRKVPARGGHRHGVDVRDVPHHQGHGAGAGGRPLHPRRPGW